MSQPSTLGLLLTFSCFEREEYDGDSRDTSAVVVVPFPLLVLLMETIVLPI